MYILILSKKVPLANHFGRDTHIEHLVSQFNLASILTTFTKYIFYFLC